MSYTTYRIPGDHAIALSFARGAWQCRLVDGESAWDGSTIEADDGFIPRVRKAGQLVEATRDDIDRHIQCRRDWTQHLIDRMRQAGLTVALDGPNARIETVDARPDTPKIAEIAGQFGLICLPVIFHSIERFEKVGDVEIYRCVVSGEHDWQRMIRADRYVVGRPEVDSGLSLRDHVCETLRKAHLRAKKVSAALPRWLEAQARYRRLVEDEAREEELATPAPAGDLFAIQEAFRSPIPAPSSSLRRSRHAR
jgi:hypothetical protein